jgi:probable phosphoglycerate mutase
VADAVDELIAAGGPWLVICHGGCVRVAAAHLTGAHPLALALGGDPSATVFELGERPRLLTYGTRPGAESATGLY